MEALDKAAQKYNLEYKYVDVAGIRTAYLEAGSGQPLILVHGGGAGADSLGNWAPCIDTFAQNFHVFAVDMVGFGQSDKPDPSSFLYDQAARDKHMAEFVETLGLGPVNMIGNSMGGLTSMGVAVARPDLVNRLVLMGSAAIQTEINPSLKSIMNYDFSYEGMRRIVEALTNDDFVYEESLIDYRHKLSIDPATRAAYEATQGWIRDRHGLYCEESHVAAVTVPTLVVSGKEDKVVPVSSAYRIIDLIPQAWGYIFPSCGHWAMLEHPDVFARLSVDFLKDK